MRAETLHPAGQPWYAYTLNNPISNTDPSGNMPIQGCGTEGKSACVASIQEKVDYAYFVQRYEHSLCEGGNMNYCSPIDKRIINNRPITGVHIGYSGQVGFAAEGGAYYQTDWLMDWVGGDLYTTRTIGAFGYGGTPTAMNGQIYAGLSGVKGIPWYYSQKSVSDALEGPQIDVAGALGIETIAVLDLGYGRSQDIDENGVYIESNGYEMY